METKFTWLPDISAEDTEEPFVQVTKYGDGYENRVPYLINTTPQNWAVTFTTNLQTHNDILNFLREHNAVYSFEWETPRGEKIKVVARNWQTRQVSFGVFQIDTNFEQVFE